MQSFVRHEGLVAPLDRVNVDTDAIIPKQFLKRIERAGFGDVLFFDWRFDPQGRENPEFVLNREPYRKATILLARANFGCGSSREHAPWALADFGFRCVIAPSFADIFFNNCFKNGMLPVRLTEAEVDELFRLANEPGGRRLTVDLENQTVTDGVGFKAAFQVDPFRKKCLLEGLDDIGLTLKHEAAISEFESRRSYQFGG
jgi:3-isopropylmalate/(R)-2-methylmalate dehydratase small subunit